MKLQNIYQDSAFSSAVIPNGTSLLYCGYVNGVSGDIALKVKLANITSAISIIKLDGSGVITYNMSMLSTYYDEISEGVSGDIQYGTIITPTTLRIGEGSTLSSLSMYPPTAYWPVYSFNLGIDNITSTYCTFATGKRNSAVGRYSMSHGYATSAYGQVSHSEGTATYGGPGSNIHVEGSYTSAYLNADHAEGRKNLVSSQFGHVEGLFNKVYGLASHGEGQQNQLNGQYSHIEGTNNILNGNKSHIEGSYNYISGDYNHAEGLSTIINGNISHAEGQLTYISSSMSHAEGASTSAITNYSHVEGQRTITSRRRNICTCRRTIYSCVWSRITC